MKDGGMIRETAKPRQNCDSLVRSGLFAGLPAEDIDALLPLLGARFLRCRKGALLVGADSEVCDIGLVLEGKLNICREDPDGNLNLVREAGPPELFCADIACTPTRISPVSVSCVTDALIMTFSYDRITAGGILPDPWRCILLRNLLEILSNNSMRQLHKIDILSQKSLRQRIVLYFILQQKRKSRTFTLSMNREQLAGYLCVDRSALSRELSRMQREGLIRYRKNRFEIIRRLTL